jgi:aspartyl-tRNA(Asn)/glutamyl-tRNA(Gln) amidotransferase subunit C
LKGQSVAAGDLKAERAGKSTLPFVWRHYGLIHGSGDAATQNKPLQRRGGEFRQWSPTSETAMAKSQIDEATVKRIAHLSRLKVSAQEAHNLKRELNGILAWVAELNAIPTEGVEPLTSTESASLRMRADAVDDGGCPDKILKNAPKTEDHFFLVPKVIE